MDDIFYDWLTKMWDEGVLNAGDLDGAFSNEREALRLYRDFLMDERQITVELVRIQLRVFLKMRLRDESNTRAIPEERESDD